MVIEAAGREVTITNPDDLTIATVPMRLAERGDPWAALNNSPQA